MTWVIILLLMLSASAAVGVRIDALTRRDKPAELSLAQRWRAMGGGYLPSAEPLGHIGATNDRTAADNNGHSRPAVALFTGHTLPPAAGRRDRSGLSDTEGAGGSTPPAPTTPAVSSAFAATSSLWWTWTGREQ